MMIVVSKTKSFNIVKYTKNNNHTIKQPIISSDSTAVKKTVIYMKDDNCYKQETNILGPYYYYLADYYLIRD